MMPELVRCPDCGGGGGKCPTCSGTGTVGRGLIATYAARLEAELEREIGVPDDVYDRGYDDGLRFALGLLNDGRDAP